MTKTSSLPLPAAAVDYDATLILSVETSNKSWVLAAHVPGLGQVKAKKTIAPTVEALMAAIEGYGRRAAGIGRTIERVVERSTGSVIHAQKQTLIPDPVRHR